MFVEFSFDECLYLRGEHAHYGPEYDVDINLLLVESQCASDSAALNFKLIAAALAAASVAVG